MTQYGVLPGGAGFRRKPLDVIMQEIGEHQRANVSPSLVTSEDSPQGQLNMSVARQVDQAWRELEKLYTLDPDKRTGAMLQMLAKLTGTVRRGASPSFVACQCNLDEGTTLLAGTHFANVVDDPDSRWTPVADFTADSDGTHEVLFQSEETGPIAATASTITVINTTLNGWNSVTNPEDATLGRTVDDDATLRERRDEDVAQAGSATARAIRADVNDVETVQSVTVFENKGDTYDARGLSPHSVEVLIDDGDPPPGDNDDEIAQAIFDAVGAGINWYSSTGDLGTATDDDGVEHIVRFSRVAYVDVHLTYSLTVGPEYAGDAAFQTFIATAAGELYSTVGANLNALRLETLALQFGGVVDVVTFALELVDPPTATDNIQLGARQKPAFDSSNVDVTS